MAVEPTEPSINEYRNYGWGVKLSTDIPLLQRLRMSGDKYFLSPVRLHGVDKETFTF
jgi:hypothetical protein